MKKLSSHLALAAGKILAIGISLSACGNVQALDAHPSKSLQVESARPLLLTRMANMDMNLQIEQVSGNAAARAPNQGVIVQHYLSDGKFTADGIGGAHHVHREGRFQFHRNGTNTATEQLTDVVNATTLTTTYTFSAPNKGEWRQTSSDSQAVSSGHFSLVPSLPANGAPLALDKLDNQNVALVIKNTVSELPAGSYPGAGLVVQTYKADGTLKFKGIGPGTIDSRGTFRYRKVSANTAVEETTQTSDFFSYPYTMVYTFDTPDSGTWYQNFYNGLIQFSGTFDTFPN